MNYFLLTYNWFKTLATAKQLGLLINLCLLSALSIGAIFWVFAPSYTVLFNNLDVQDASEIITQLETEQISYHLQNKGRDILIDTDLVDKTRLKIMGSGMQFKGNVGFELFDKSDFGMTDFSQKINYQRALQGELERTIAHFEEIQQARVHLVLPEQHLFAEEENPPKAAVTVYLKNPITPKQVQSIQQLITASVAHLNKQNVVIIDQHGNTLSVAEEDSINSQFTSKKLIEQYLSGKIKQLLQKIFPHNQMVVTIDVSINYDELQRELIKPQNAGLVTHEKQMRHSAAQKTIKDKPMQQDISTEKTYQVGTEKELFKRANGSIERLSISIAVPRNTDKHTLEQVTNLVKNTVGFNEKRGDKISVEALIAKLPKTPTAQINPTIIKPLSFYKSNLFYFLLPVLLMTAIGSFALKKIRHKQRQILLLELTQWLSHHE